MRHVITGLVAGAALAVAMNVAPANACAVIDPCSSGYQHQQNYSVQQHYGVQQQSYDADEGTAARLADPMGPQYYYVNHGPLYTGPGRLAPAPTYQERAVIGWHGYHRAHRYHRPYHGYRAYRPRYTGGPYANPTTHYYHGAPRVHGPAVYTYHPRRAHFLPRRAPAYYAARPAVRYAHPGMMPRRGYAPRFYAPAPMAHGPRARMVPHAVAPHRMPRIDK